MKLGHVALWTNQLEELKTFYIKYFHATSNNKYLNKKTEFESYFLTFDSGSKLELMSIPSLKEDNNLSSGTVGIAHLAFSTGTKDAVDSLTETLRKDGYSVLSEPRVTGDGYYESVILDPDGNSVEIVL